jgi:hypothetical protein
MGETPTSKASSGLSRKYKSQKAGVASSTMRRLRMWADRDLFQISKCQLQANDALQQDYWALVGGWMDRFAFFLHGFGWRWWQQAYGRKGGEG